MDDQRKDYIDPKDPPRRNRPRILQTQNVPTYHVENTYSTNKGKDLFLAKPLIIPLGKERMRIRIQRLRRITLYSSAHPHKEQDCTEKI